MWGLGVASWMGIGPLRDTWAYDICFRFSELYLLGRRCCISARKSAHPLGSEDTQRRGKSFNNANPPQVSAPTYPLLNLHISTDGTMVLTIFGLEKEKLTNMINP